MSGLTFDERWELWADAQRTMTHFECQPTYQVDDTLFTWWMVEPETVGSLRAHFVQFDQWCRLVEQLTARGVVVHRIRVLDDPLNPYQRFARWAARENMAAGERIWEVDRDAAVGAGLPVRIGQPDWWIIDDQYLMHQAWRDGVLVDAHLHFEPDAIRAADRWADTARRLGTELRPLAQ